MLLSQATRWRHDARTRDYLRKASPIRIYHFFLFPTSRTVPPLVFSDNANRREQQPFNGDKAGRQGLLSALKGGLDPTSSTLREAGSTETAGAKRVQIVDWEGYRKIDRDEVARGVTKGKPREKLVDINEMLKIAEADRGQ